MHERRRAFERLHQIGLERILEQRAHGAFRMQLARRDRGVGGGVSHDDARQARLEVRHIGRQAEHSHDLGCDRDVEAVFARDAVRRAA